MDRVITTFAAMLIALVVFAVAGVGAGLQLASGDPVKGLACAAVCALAAVVGWSFACAHDVACEDAGFH